MNQRLIRPLVYAGITAFVGFGMSGCFLAEQQHQQVGYSVTEQVRTLVIAGHTGDVRVTGGSAGSAVKVTEHQDYRDQPPATSHTTSADGTLTLTYDCSDCGVSYDVEVPAGTVVKVTEQTGSVHLTGLTAEVEATTRSGDVEARALGSGTARLSTGTGSVSAAFATAPAAVEAETGTGDVRVAVPAGAAYAVTVHTGTGSAKVTVPQEPDAAHRITAKSQTGDVTVTRA